MTTLDSVWYPVQRPGVAVVSRENRVILHDAQGDEVFELNPTALALWELCDGETSTEEIVDAVVTLFDASEHVIVRDVAAALDRLVELGLLSGTERGSRGSRPRPETDADG